MSTPFGCSQSAHDRRRSVSPTLGRGDVLKAIAIRSPQNQKSRKSRWDERRDSIPRAVDQSSALKTSRFRIGWRSRKPVVQFAESEHGTTLDIRITVETRSPRAINDRFVGWRDAAPRSCRCASSVRNALQLHSRFGACPDPSRHARELHQSRNRSRPAPVQVLPRTCNRRRSARWSRARKPGSPSLDFARTDYAVGGKHKA